MALEMKNLPGLKAGTEIKARGYEFLIEDRDKAAFLAKLARAVFEHSSFELLVAARNDFRGFLEMQRTLCDVKNLDLVMSARVELTFSWHQEISQDRLSHVGNLPDTDVTYFEIDEGMANFILSGEDDAGARAAASRLLAYAPVEKGV